MMKLYDLIKGGQADVLDTARYDLQSSWKIAI